MDSIEVLVADRSKEERQSAEQMLSAIPGVRVHIASDGPEAMNILRTSPIRIAIIDRKLPGFDGSVLTAWRKRMGQDALVVMSSTQLTPGWDELARSIGAYDVLLKPWNEDALSKLMGVYRRMRNPSPVLIVSPSQGVIGAIGTLCKSSRFKLAVKEAESGPMALRVAKLTPIDIAFIDDAVTSPLDLACELKDADPRIKIFLVGRNCVNLADTVLATFNVLDALPKPFYEEDFDVSLFKGFGLWRPYLLNAKESCMVA